MVLAVDWTSTLLERFSSMHPESQALQSATRNTQREKLVVGPNCNSILHERTDHLSGSRPNLFPSRCRLYLRGSGGEILPAVEAAIMSDTQDGVTRLDQALARVSAMLGLAGSLFIIATFVLQPRLRRPMNRLLFYTSLGNLFLDTFYFVSVWGIPKPGGSMHLCRTQGFMIQMYIPSIFPPCSLS